MDEQATTLTATGDHLLLQLPVHSVAGGESVSVAADLLDTLGVARSHGASPCRLTAAVTLCRLELLAATPDVHLPHAKGDDLPLFRVRYTVSASVPQGLEPHAVTGILSVDHIAPGLFELHVAAPKDIRLGNQYVARVRAVHPLTRTPQPGVSLEATLTASYMEQAKQDLVLGSIHVVTDSDGYASIPFTVPADLDISSVDLDVDGAFASFKLSTTQTLDVPSNRRFDLTTDKPLYQPGQTVHTRLLLLDRNAHASAGRTVRVDISDPDGTLVFRGTAVTSTYGIATVDWPVPDRMRLGEYSLDADVPDDPDGDVRDARATIRLSRYDLPTFVVTPKPDRTFYLPGSQAVVDVRAQYLFGKPVLRGHVRVVREDDRTWNFAEQRFDVKEGQTVTGELGAGGSFRARIDLSHEWTPARSGEPSNSTADLHLAAYVTDASTGRTEQRRFDLRLAEQALHVYVTGSEQVRGLPLQSYVSVTAADGTPVACDLTVSLLPAETSRADSAKPESFPQRVARAVLLDRFHTDAHGLAIITLPLFEELLKRQPAPLSGNVQNTGQVTLYITAGDAAGRTGSVEQAESKPSAALRVGTSQTLYRPGDPIHVTLDSALPALPITVQLLRRTQHGDVLLDTRAVTLLQGHADMTFPSDARFSGFVFVEAVALAAETGNPGNSYYGYEGSDAHTVRASRALLFPRNNTLQVGIALSAATYKPGAEASAVLTVRGPPDPDGDDRTTAPSALGLVAIDQALEERNRTDSDFGGAGSQPFFFATPADYANPAGDFSVPVLQQLDLSKPWPDGAQLAAAVLLDGRALQFSTANDAAPDDLANVFKGFLNAQLTPARVALLQYGRDHTEFPTTGPELAALLAPAGVDLLALRDPWGRPYHLADKPDSYGQASLVLVSDGPDKQHGTADDFPIALATWHWFNGHVRDIEHATAAFHQSTGGYIRDLGQLRTEMRKEEIDFDQWRDPWGQPFTYRFSIQGTSYTIEVLSPGDPSQETRYQYGPYIVGTASMNYAADLQHRLEAALNRYATTHPFPSSDAQFQAALRSAGISSMTLRDPWGRALYVRFRSHAFFTNSVRTEAHATPATQPVVRTIVTPVTAVSDIIDLHSLGRDGQRNTPDDFLFASFSHVRSPQSAQDISPRRASRGTVHAGPSGDITGTVTDPTGAVIPGATVLATHVKSGVEYEIKADKDGSYLLGPVPVGAYTVRFRVPGFLELVVDSVIVSAGGSATLDAKLNVGSVSEAVQVSADLPILQTSSAEVASSASSNMTLGKLPLESRALAVILPGLTAGVQPTATPRLRDYFPETLLWRPEIITAPDGTATVHFPVADNITTWRLYAAASTLQGNTGGGAAEFATFQPFFAAFDPPAVLTTGDTVALPVTLRNYLDHAVIVQSSLSPAPWFRVDGAASQTTAVGSQQSASPVFRFTALLPVHEARQEVIASSNDSTAQDADAAGDRVARPVTVHPDGRETAITASAILSPGDTALTVTLPADTLPHSTDATLKIYPNLGAHLRDALTAMATYPNGCAEQILSTAWPSLLLQRYMANLPAADDEAAAERQAKLQRQTHLYLEQAYENLLANQLRTGGFAYWPHDTHADVALTAYAVQFLHEAGSFITVDPKVLDNAVAWLAHEQQADGRWLRVDFEHKPHPEDLHGSAMLTDSVAAMIAGAPKTEPLLRKALAATQSFVAEFDEPYTLTSYALAALALHDSTRSDPAISRLRTLALSENGGAYWSLETNTPFFGWGRAGRVESSAQAMRALLASGASPSDDLIARGLLFLEHEQDRHSLWYSTQATARVLDVLAALALRTPLTAGSNASVPGSLAIRIDGNPATSVPLPAPTIDAGPIFVALNGALASGSHRITLTLPAGSPSATAQLVASLYQPWPAVSSRFATTNNEQLRLSVGFSNARPAPGQPVTVDAQIERIGFRGYGMLLAEIGLPPGADVDRASLEAAVNASGSQLDRYEVLPDRLLLYVWPKAGGVNLRFRFNLRFGVNALTAPSIVYDYYNPDAHFDVPPVRFQSR